MSREAAPRRERTQGPGLVLWLFLAPLVLLILLCVGQLALLELGHGETPNLRSQLRADYRPWPTTVFGALNPSIIDELLRDQGFTGAVGEFVIPGQLWLTPVNVTAPPPTAPPPTPVVTVIAAVSTTPSPSSTSTATAPASQTPLPAVTSPATQAPTNTTTPVATATPLPITNPPGPTDTPPPTLSPTASATATPTATPASVALSGRAFEDVNYGGGAGGAFGPGDVALPNVRVDLYTSGGSFVGFTATDATGVYTFTVLSNGSYRVRVVSASLGDADTPPAAGLNFATSVVAEQTYESDGVVGNGGAGALGGDNPLVDDAATPPGAGIGDASVLVTLSGGPLAGVDFGFAYNLIVNTLDGGQGSLRRFLLNANAIAGPNAAQFSIPTTDPNYNTVVPNTFAIRPAAGLPALNDGATGLDGTTQEANRGDQRPGLPDVVIDGQAAGANVFGLDVQSSFNVIRGLDVRNFDQGSGTGIQVVGDSNILANNYLTRNSSNSGTGAIQVVGQADLNQFTGNLIDGNFGDGLEFGSSANTGNVVAGNTFSNNADDGMVVQGDAMTVTNNTSQFNGVGSPLGCGIEVPVLTNSVIANNISQGNGQRGGVCVFIADSIGNVIGPGNVVSGNEGPGISILTPASVRNRITGNSVFGNTGLGIDLAIDGVTLNDISDGDTGPNNLMNYPVLYSATLDGLGNVIVTGEARPNSAVEFYIAAPDPTGYGEGQTLIGATTVTSGVAGTNDLTAWQFNVTLPAGSLTSGSAVTATATDGAGNTSEFALNIVVP